MSVYGIIMVVAAFLAAFSQVLLKLSTRDEHATALSVYLNAKVISAYAILGITMLMNVYAFTGIEYRFGAVLTSSSYLFTMVFSAVILNEKLGWRCVAGNLMVLIGIVVYTLGK